MLLLVQPAEGPSFEHEFDGDSVVIGRASTSDLVISDPFLSRHHARIFQQREETLIEDLDSRNGTEVNGVSIRTATKLEPGDSIRLSGSRIDVEYPSARVSTVDLQATVLKPAVEFLRSAEIDTKGDDVDAKRLRNYADRLRRLNDVYRRIGATLSLEDLESVFLDTVMDELRPEHSMIFLRTSDGSYDQTAARSSDQTSRRPPPASRRLIEEVCQRGMSALVTDVSSDERFADSQSLILAGAASLAAAPLLYEHGALGMVVISSSVVVREFREEDLELLTSIASVAALKIRNLRLAQAALARQRHQQELTIARRIQESLLPQRLPEFEGLELFAHNLPSRGVSGDFYQVLDRPRSNQCLSMVVDVSGKGVPAALLTASIEALAVAPIEEALAPDEVFRSVSRRLYERSPPEKYATAFLSVVDTRDGTVQFANAGHNPSLLIRRDGSCAELIASGRPLGLVAGSTYELGECQLATEDALLAYTDGLTEAENGDGEQYGLERLQASAVRHRTLPIEQYGDAILEDIRAFTGDVPPIDDATLVIARRMG